MAASGQPPEFEADPLKYTHDLLLDILFPATKEFAEARLRGQAYMIAATLLSIIQHDRKLLETYLLKLDTKTEAKAELEALRKLVEGKAHPHDCACDTCLPL